jgi:adenine deaminase
LQRLILVTDSLAPDDVAERGHMDNVVQRAIALGLSPMQALQAVTLSPATYSGLEQEIGGIAPGRWADMVLLDDLEKCHVHATVIAGKTVAKAGESLVSRTPSPPPEEMLNCLAVPPVSPATFRIPCAKRSATIRVIELINQTITAERVMAVHTDSGSVDADPSEDLLKIAVFGRHQGTGRAAFGFLKGFGAKLGAIGATTNLDENTLMVVGSRDEDMALCANALIECGGGIAVVNRGQLLEKLEFLFGGVFSLQPWREVGSRLKRIQDCLRESGSPFDKPLYALSFLTFVTLPALRITARGLINAKERKIVSLFAE